MFFVTQKYGNFNGFGSNSPSKALSRFVCSNRYSYSNMDVTGMFYFKYKISLRLFSNCLKWVIIKAKCCCRCSRKRWVNKCLIYFLSVRSVYYELFHNEPLTQFRSQQFSPESAFFGRPAKMNKFLNILFKYFYNVACWSCHSGAT